MFAFQDRRASVEVAFTDRFGGASTGPYAELNLSTRGGEGEDADTVRSNLDLVAAAFGQEAVRGVVAMRQVHGAGVAVVDDGHRDADPEADALVTAAPGQVLVARGADCIPVLLADTDRGVVAAVHAGRAGLVAGVVPRAVAAMRHLGAVRLTAWLGPRACGRCYEVPSQLREEVAAAVPASWSETSWGTPALDLAAGIAAQLDGLAAEVVDVDRCTIEDRDFYSYRRQGTRSGRHGGLVWVRP